jgi:hypothetical protein
MSSNCLSESAFNALIKPGDEAWQKDGGRVREITGNPCKWCSGNGYTNLKILYLRTRGYNERISRQVYGNTSIITAINSNQSGKCWMCWEGKEITTESAWSEINELNKSRSNLFKELEVETTRRGWDEATKQEYKEAMEALAELDAVAADAEAFAATKEKEWKTARADANKAHWMASNLQKKLHNAIYCPNDEDD